MLDLRRVESLDRQVAGLNRLKWSEGEKPVARQAKLQEFARSEKDLMIVAPCLTAHLHLHVGLAQLKDRVHGSLPLRRDFRFLVTQRFMLSEALTIDS